MNYVNIRPRFKKWVVTMVSFFFFSKLRPTKYSEVLANHIIRLLSQRSEEFPVIKALTPWGGSTNGTNILLQCTVILLKI